MKAINLMLIVLGLMSTDIALGQNPAPGDIQPAESAPSSGVNVHEKIRAVTGMCAVAWVRMSQPILNRSLKITI